MYSPVAFHQSFLLSLFEDAWESYDDLYHNDNRALRENVSKSWVQRIRANPHQDPAQSFLQSIIFADAPRILADLYLPNSRLLPHIFPEIDTEGDDVPRITYRDVDEDCVFFESPSDYADFLFGQNTIFDPEDGLPTGRYSETIDLLVKYIRGAIVDPAPLLYALAARLWRNKEVRGTIQTHTLFFHLQMFHLPHIKRDKLVSRLPLATRDVWDNALFSTGEGHSELGLLDPVIVRRSPDIHDDHDYCELETRESNRPPFESHIFGSYLYHEKTIRLEGGHTVTLADFADDGMAVLVPLPGNMYHAYFLGFPEDYDDALMKFFYRGPPAIRAEEE